VIEDLKLLRFPLNFMKDGLIFIWSEKETIADVIKLMEAQKFIYVENVCWVILDPEMKQSKQFLIILKASKTLAVSIFLLHSPKNKVISLTSLKKQ